MDSILKIPEIAGLDSRKGVIRIPPGLDVPLTDRVRRIIDTAEFRRLAHISQLGLVSLIYPAALHTRFEHSLGVFRLALLFLKRLAHDRRFVESISTEAAQRFMVSALLHDLGHWPFCHTIEDMGLKEVPHHEQFAAQHLIDSPIGDFLREDWGIEPESVVQLLEGKGDDFESRILDSLLSGPVDIDKMDYLFRDSLHAGVPYGKNFDQERLIGSLCLDESGSRLAITDKGKTATEMMVFSRYVMFSEVYWHHGVRAATAMLQRAFWHLREQLDLQSLFQLTEGPFIACLQEASGQGPARGLLDGLFGSRRMIYKRLAQYSFFEQPDIYGRLSGRPYPWLVECAGRFAGLLSRAIGQEIDASHILFDAPPAHKEVELTVQIHYTKEGKYRWLDEVSPVVRTLARDQFDDYVKRVRIFIHPEWAEKARDLDDFDQILNEAIDSTD
jgi:uncharacterized protein